MSSSEFGYNVSRILLNELYQPVNDYKQMNEDIILQRLEVRGQRLKDISRLVSELTNKKPSGKANCNGDPTLISTIDRIREQDTDENGRSVIESHKYSWDSEEDISAQLQALNDLTKRLGDEANLDMMRVQHVKQDKTQVTETTKKAIEEQIELIKIMQRRAGN